MSIRSTVPAVVALLFALAAADVSAGQRHGFGNDERGCSVESDYTIRVDGEGIRLDADDDAQVPRRIDVRNGTLRVDGKPQSVSAADARRLREMESGTRALLPEIAGITREAIGITFDTLATVNHALTGSRRQARAFDRLRARSLARIDDTLGRGIWSPDTFGDDFEAEIEAAAEAMAANFTPSRALWMVMTGGIGRMERRMEKMEGEVERSVEAREGTLQRHATALCSQLETLDGLQKAMEFRFDDGQPLRVFEFDPRNGDKDEALQASAP